MSNSNNAATKQVREEVAEIPKNIEIKTENTVDNLNGKFQVEAKKIGETTVKYDKNVSKNLTSSDELHKKADTKRGFLSDKTDIIDKYAHQTIEKANQIGHRAVEILANSSSYVKTLNVTETRRQITDKIKEKPELSIAVAGVFGLMIGLLIGRKK